MKTIRQLRQERGWAQLDVAVRLGVAASRVSAWERGLVMPSDGYRRRLAALFGVSRADIAAERPRLERQRARYRYARVVPLAQGFALIPLTKELYDEITSTSVAGAAGEVPGAVAFVHLSAGVAAWLQQLSSECPVAYVEAEFFGGVGWQCAVAWRTGQVVFGPVKCETVAHERSGHWTSSRNIVLGPELAQDVPLREGAINQALRFLGVSVGDKLDEFEALGLGQHRLTADWTEGAS